MQQSRDRPVNLTQTVPWAAQQAARGTAPAEGRLAGPGAGLAFQGWLIDDLLPGPAQLGKTFPKSWSRVFRRPARSARELLRNTSHVDRRNLPLHAHDQIRPRRSVGQPAFLISAADYLDPPAKSAARWPPVRAAHRRDRSHRQAVRSPAGLTSPRSAAPVPPQADRPAESLCHPQDRIAPIASSRESHALRRSWVPSFMAVSAHLNHVGHLQESWIGLWPRRTSAHKFGREAGRSGSRRVDGLRETKVITGFTVQVDNAKLGWGVEAFTEVRYVGTIKVDEIVATAVKVPEVQAIYTMVGDPDALVQVRVRDIAHLQDVIDTLRRTGTVTGTKTLMVLGSWSGRD